jgi:hypothetical protein
VHRTRAALGLTLARHALDFNGGARHDRDACSFARKRQRHGATDAAPAARDECDSVRQFQIEARSFKAGLAVSGL